MSLPDRRSFLFGVAAGAFAASEDNAPVVVELFTSEGCSSCPPADRVLSRLARGELARGVRVIALSEHVDYWNQLGWKDPFSSNLFSMRQQEYVSRLRANGAYTPQMVIDGSVEFVGSDVRQAESAIARAARSRKARARIERAGDSLSILLDPLSGSAETADVFAAITEDGLETKVGAGENGGRTLPHDAVVRWWQRAGTWRAAESLRQDVALRVRPGWNRQALRAVVIAQSRKTGRILAATSASLKS